MATGTVQVTAEDLLAMPDDGVERWIMRGELRERSMSFRNFWHSESMSLIDFALRNWIRSRPRPRGTICVGDAGVRIQKDPEITVGIDLVYLGPGVPVPGPTGSTVIEGLPTLAIEILSPSDRQEDVEEKIDSYLEFGISQVWSVNPRRRTVTVYRPGQEPLLFNQSQELIADPELPGFRVPVLSLFEDTAP